MTAVTPIPTFPHQGRGDFTYPCQSTRGGKGLVHRSPQITRATLLRRREVPAVPHGFRSSFKDWRSADLGEGYDITQEMALAHNVGNATGRAYSRTELLGTRRVLMEAWGRFLIGDSPNYRSKSSAAGGSTPVRWA